MSRWQRSLTRRGLPRRGQVPHDLPVRAGRGLAKSRRAEDDEDEGIGDGVDAKESDFAAERSAHEALLGGVHYAPPRVTQATGRAPPG